MRYLCSTHIAHFLGWQNTLDLGAAVLRELLPPQPFTLTLHGIESSGRAVVISSNETTPEAQSIEAILGTIATQEAAIIPGSFALTLGDRVLTQRSLDTLLDNVASKEEE